MRPRPTANPSTARQPARGRRGAFAGAVLLGLALGAPLAGAQQPAVRLPTMGEPAEQTLSPREEQLIGRSFMREVRARYEVIDDPEVQTYLSSLGARLVRADTVGGETFTFFMVRDPSINAFAAPGGYVGINTGLILATAEEAQLASVLAHEIAHVTQRHLARAFASAERSSVPTAAALIAAILLGGVNPQASQAALATTIAANAQQQINYTRSNEQEADRVGIGTLAAAGYDPLAMAETFDLLRRAHGLGGNQPPEYLSTHPVSDARIAEARDRAAALRPARPVRDHPGFQLTKVRVSVLVDPNPGQLARKLEDQALTAPEAQRSLLLYGAAVGYLRAGDGGRARPLIAELRRRDAGELGYWLLDAVQMVGAGETARGQAEFEAMLQLYPGHYPVIVAYAQSLLDAGKPQAAGGMLRAYVRDEPGADATVFRLLAAAEERANNRLSSLEALARFHYLRGEIPSAIQSLRTAANLAPAGSEDQLRINARLEKLREEAAVALQQTKRPP